MTAAKQDLIEEGRSEGEKLAHGLALAALSTDTPAVLKVAEVRRWVARTLGREIDKTESELRLRKAMLAAGMKEPRDRNGKVTRVKIDGLYHNVVATFDQDVV